MTGLWVGSGVVLALLGIAVIVLLYWARGIVDAGLRAP